MFHSNARGGVLMDILHCDTTFIENLAGRDRVLYREREKYKAMAVYTKNQI